MPVFRRPDARNDRLILDLPLAVETLSVDNFDVPFGDAERTRVLGLHEEVILACPGLSLLVLKVQLEDRVWRGTNLAREVQNAKSDESVTFIQIQLGSREHIIPAPLFSIAVSIIAHAVLEAKALIRRHFI